MTAPTADRESLRNKRLQELAALRVQYWELIQHREIWRQMSSALATDGGDQWFLRHYTRLYLVNVTMSLRRLCDEPGDGVTLPGLIDAILRNPATFTKDEFVRLWDEAHYLFDEMNDEATTAIEELRRRAGAKFDDQWGLSNGQINPEILSAMSKQLRDSSMKIRRFADKAVAHLDKRELPPVPAVSELDECIDTVGETLNRCHLLLLDATLETDPPAFDWHEPFRCALFSDSGP